MPRFPPLLRGATIAFVGLLLFYLGYHTTLNKRLPPQIPSFDLLRPSKEPPTESPTESPTQSETEPERYVSCFSARGKLLSESPDDALQERVFDHDAALDLDMGTYRDLPLKRTWSTADGRYGPYGRGEKKPPSEYNRTRVPWYRIDWAELQNNCTRRNIHRFGGKVEEVSPVRRLAYPTRENSRLLPPRPPKTTGRTAIVLRGWEEFIFRDLDRWSLRALITETALEYGGDYAVFLLVDIHDEQKKIFRNADNYEAALDSVVPKEFRNITVLFDLSLLEEWYPRTPDHTLAHQDWQPMQIFAHFFNHFDHYWQVELDARFTGHAGKFLESLSTFARNEPRKQAYERSTYAYFESAYGSYANLISAVNATLDGSSRYWSGAKIPDIEFAVPEPAGKRAEDDDFKWGVGDDADCLLLGPCHNLTRSRRPYHRQFVHGFQLGRKTQRTICPPAAARASWNLLNGIHNAQLEKGLAVPSEATPASFAMWLNLKLSRPPFPIFFSTKYNMTQVDILMNGGPPQRRWHGMSHSMGSSPNPENRRKHGVFVDNVDPTWRPSAKQAQEVSNAWLSGSIKTPWARPLFVQDGEVWMTNTFIHPVKTNHNGPKNYGLPDED